MIPEQLNHNGDHLQDNMGMCKNTKMVQGNWRHLQRIYTREEVVGRYVSEKRMKDAEEADNCRYGKNNKKRR